MQFTQNSPRRDVRSPGALCLLALTHVRVKPLAQKVSDYLCSDRDKEIDEIYHALHLPPAAGMGGGQHKKYITKSDRKQRKGTRPDAITGRVPLRVLVTLPGN